MPSDRKIARPKDDAGYFERLSKVLFTAGLNWTVVENKWPNFQRAFAGFDPELVAKMTHRDIRSLMGNGGIVRNEKKIVATIHNADEFLRLRKEFGSFRAYLDSMGKDERRLQTDIQKRFKHVGPSTARMFLWTAGHKLTPTAEEKAWIAKNE